MDNCCVNPACRAEFKLLNNGDLYAVGRPLADPEFFWICSACASRFHVGLDAEGEVELRTRTDWDELPSHLHEGLRLVDRGVRNMPWLRQIRSGVRTIAKSSKDQGGPAHGAYV